MSTKESLAGDHFTEPQPKIIEYPSISAVHSPTPIFCPGQKPPRHLGGYGFVERTLLN